MTRILLIEDNELSADMLSRRLQRSGYEVLTAAEGLAGAALAHACRPDLIIMDLALPDLDGREVTRRIKATPELSHIPVLALTAQVMPGDEASAYQAGCSGYETKPVNMPRLLQKIAGLLADR